jgi:hypothetical protein
MRVHSAFALLALLFVTAGLPGQGAPATLRVNGADDVADRAVFTELLRRQRGDLVLTDASPQDLAQFLTIATQRRAQFLVAPTVAKHAPAPMTFELRKLPLLDVLATVARVTDLRFVVAHGVIWIEHKDDLKEWTPLRLYDVRAATFRLRDFPGPELGITIGEKVVEPPPDDTERTPCGFTAEKLVELIKMHVQPDSWQGGNASISVNNGVLTIRQSESAHAEIVDLLVQLGVIWRPRLVRAPVMVPVATPAAPASRPASR